MPKSRQIAGGERVIPSIRLLEHAGATFAAISRRREWLVLALLLAMVGTASAQFTQAVPGTQRALCTDFPNPVANATWCADGNNGPNYTWKVWDGTQYITITGGGGGGGNVTGSGITNFLPVWTNGASSILGNSILQQATNTLIINPGNGSQQTIEASSSGAGGAGLVVKSGDALSGAGGTLSLQGGTSTAGLPGGHVEILGQSGVPGGQIVIRSGASTSGAGNFISLLPGNAPGTGGAVFIEGGTSTASTGGLVRLLGGAGTGAAGGAVTIAGGPGTSTGAVTIQGLTYPAVDGAAGQVITTNGAGVLTFSNAGAGSVTGSGTTNTLSKFTGSTAIGNSTITDNGTTVALGATNVKLTNQVAGSGHTCLQVDTTGVITQTGLPCASGFSGTVTISGSNTTGAVVFSSTQPDTTYTVTLGTRSSAGTPPAVVADYKSKATTGFTVEISAPPGGGNSIDVDWQIGSGNFTIGSGSGTVTSIATTSPITGGTITTTGTIGCATCVTGGSLTSGQLVTGNTGQAITVGNLSGDVTTSGSTVTTLASRYKTWTCTVPFGDPGAASLVLTNDNDAPWACQNHTGSDVTITTVTCVADAGTPTVTPITTGGGATSILSGALTCGTATFAAGSLNGTPVLHSFSGTGATCSSTPCSADVNITTAGGTAKYLVVNITGTY